MADVQGGAQQVTGGTPHDSVDADNPVKIGGTATADSAVAVTADGDRVDASYTLEGEARVEQRSLVDGPNSSTTPLSGGGGTFTGVAQSALGFASVVINVFADQLGQTNGIRLEWSSNGTDWDMRRRRTYGVAGAGKAFAFPVEAEFYRTVYINGGTAQTAFRLQTLAVRADVANWVQGDMDPDQISSEGQRLSVPIGGRARTTTDTSFSNDDRRDAIMSPEGAMTIAGHDGSGPVNVLVTSTGQIEVVPVGNVAHDAPDSGNPVKSGGRARTTAIAAVATDDRTDAIYSPTGAATIAGSAAGVPTNVEVGTAGQVNVDGDVAHDAADAGNPVSLGAHAEEFAAEPATVSASDDRTRLIASPQGILFTLGGHPNVISREYMTTGAQTNDPIIDTVAAGSHIVLLGIEVLHDGAGTAIPAVRVGFGTASVPAEPASGASVTGVVLSHPGIAAGSGVVRGNGGGILGVGGSDEELRITCGAPTTGQFQIIATYYIATL